jgi:hypothetical protein
MAQRIINGEQYEVLLIRGDINGSPVPVTFASGVTISGVTIGAQVEVTNDSGNPLPVSDAGSSLTVDGKAYRSIVSFVRPGDTTSYTAGDVIGTSAGSAIHTLSGVGPSGGFVLVQNASLFIGNTSVPAGMGAFRLHFYSANPSGIADNAAFNVQSADVAVYMGYADLPTPQDLGSTLYTQTEYVGRQLKLASGQTSLFAELETRGAYTPASGTTYEIRVSTLEAGL